MDEQDLEPWTVETEELIEWFEAERAVIGSDYAAARTVIEATQGERLDEEALVAFASGVLEGGQEPADVRLSPRAQQRVRAGQLDWNTRRSWEDLSQADQVAIFAVGLIELAREYEDPHGPGGWSIEIGQLARRFNHERAADGSDYGAAHTVIDAAQGERFDERLLVAYACEAFEDGREPPDIKLSAHAGQLMRTGGLDWRAGEPWEDLPRADQVAIFAAGLVTRAHELTPWPTGADTPDIPYRSEQRHLNERKIPELPGTTDYHAWTREQYTFWFYLDRQGQGCLDLLVGWVPGGVAGLLVGLIGANATGSWWLLPFIAVTSAVLGYIATGLGHVLLERADVDWLRLGHREGTAWVVVYFGTGPLIALLIGALML